MSLVAHLVRKDWVRARPGLVAWYALIAGKAWCVWQLLRSGDASANLHILGSFVDALNGLEAVAGALLAAQLALEDPPHSPNAFWATRPLTRVQLLKAKSLGALLFLIAAPLVLLTPVWLAAGFSVSEFFAAATDWALIQGLFVALGLLAGVLARDLGQIFLGGPLLGLALLGVGIWLRREPAPPAWLSAGMGLGVAAVGVAFAYALRRRAPAFAVVVVGFVVAAGFGLPSTEPREFLTPFPAAEKALAIGEIRAEAAHIWRLIALENYGSQAALVVQSARPWFGLHSRMAGESKPRYTLLDPESTRLTGLVPERLGTVQAASLRVTRWRLALPTPFKTPARDVRLFAAPPATAALSPQAVREP